MNKANMKKHVTRKLRRDQTPWESKLWQVLRNRNIEGLKFRRQFKIGNYVVDFVCLSKKLVIELDGGHHSESRQKKKDEIRQKYIESQGFKVLRFWNNEVLENLEGVVQKILDNI